MRPLDPQTLKRFVELAGERLTGDWVVIGGMVLPLLGEAHRVTLDIDVAGPEGSSQDQLLTLMRIAEELGLPVEAINQAGAYFLHRIEGWQEHLIEIHRGSGATLHVPDPTLFVLLKVSRLTETDLDDCEAMLALARKREIAVDRARLIEAVGAALAEEESEARAGRLESLLEALQG